MRWLWPITPTFFVQTHMAETHDGPMELPQIYRWNAYGIKSYTVENHILPSKVTYNNNNDIMCINHAHLVRRVYITEVLKDIFFDIIRVASIDLCYCCFSLTIAAVVVAIP